MRILFLTPTLPVTVGGGRTRPFNLIKQLAPRHEITVMSFIQPSDRAYLDTLSPYCVGFELVPLRDFSTENPWLNRLKGWSQILFSRRPRYVATFPVARLRRPLRRLLASQRFDVVVFEQLFLAELLPEVGDLPVVLGEQNVESDIARRACLLARGPVHRFRDWLTWRKLQAFEKRWLKCVDACAAVSERDARLLAELAPGLPVHIVPNGVDSSYFAPDGADRDPDTLLFFGTLNYPPNADGLLWFCREVFPRLHKARPGLRLDVIGQNPPAQIAALDQEEGIHIRGFVNDIRPALWSAAVCVVPLFVGGGTRLKILEALAAGCPVVSTTLGAEGLSLEPGVHFLPADTPDAFGAAVARLLDSPALRAELAANGRRLVAERYDWASIAPGLEAACRNAIECHGARSGARPGGPAA